MTRDVDMLQFRRIASYALLVGLVFLCVASPVMAQYIYLDANGNGVHDAGDIIQLPCAIDIWLDTSKNKDGSPAVCGTGPQPLSFNSYEFILHAVGGTISYGPFTNNMADFATRMTRDERDTTEVTYYHNGWAGGASKVPGLYLLGRLSITVLSGSPSIEILATHPGHGWMATGFGTPCAGNAAREHWHRKGVQWNDADGVGPSPSGPGVFTAPGVVAPRYLDPVTFTVFVNGCDASSVITADLSVLPAGNDATFTAAPPARTFTWDPAAGDFGDFIVPFTAHGCNCVRFTRNTDIHLVAGVPTAVDESGSERYALTLFPNRPNPLNPSTVISYSVPGLTRVQLTLFDLSGRIISRLADRFESAGPHEVRWSGTDDRGKPLASGVYWCRLTTAFGTRARTLVVAR